MNGTPLHEEHLTKAPLLCNPNESFRSTGPSPSTSGLDGNNNNAASTVTSSPAPCRKSLSYLRELFYDRERLQGLASTISFHHLHRLVEQEIQRVRTSLIHIDGASESRPHLALPEPEGEKVQRSEKIFVPVDKHPEHNFVGRIIGPRGLTIRELEMDSGCKLYIRGRGSMRNKEKEEEKRGQPNWEHLNEDLHVLVMAEDTENRVMLKLNYAVEQINKVIENVISQKDDFKARQLAELAILNDKYRIPESPSPVIATPPIASADFGFLAANTATAPFSYPTLPYAALSQIGLDHMTGLGSPLMAAASDLVHHLPGATAISTPPRFHPYMSANANKTKKPKW